MLAYYIFFLIINFLIFKNLNLITNYLNFYDLPDKRKIHKKKISKIGGIVLYINILLYYLINLFFQFSEFNFYLLIFLSLIFFINLVNDKKDISPSLRLITCYLIFLVWCFIDKSLVIKNLYFEFIDLNINLGQYGYLITPLFFVIFLNALNLFDGVNLQSISYIFLFFIFFLLNEIDLSNHLYLFIFFIFFSIYNLKNKIFLGDSGISIFATLITYIIITNYNFEQNLLNCEEILAMMFLPGIDMLRLFLYRISKKKNPFNPDKNHLHHHILRFVLPKFVFLYQFFFYIILLFLMYFLYLSYYLIFIILIIMYVLALAAFYDKKYLSKNI